MGDTTTGEEKKRGRKAETPEQRLLRLERDVALAKKAVAEARQRQLATIGQAVLEEAKDNDAFRGQLHKLLQVRVTTRAGKADLGGVLEGD